MKDNAQVQKIKTELAEFDLTEENALNKFILAGFYEEHKLIIDAIAAYEDAVRLAPDVDSYKEAYEEFLLRNKLKEPK
jgi:tetratricopeptide (TPR) repeat protein